MSLMIWPSSNNKRGNEKGGISNLKNKGFDTPYFLLVLHNTLNLELPDSHRAEVFNM